MVSLLERARSGNPSALAPRLLLSSHYLIEGNSRKLLKVITEASVLSPEHPDVLLLLGQAQRLNNNTAGSLSTLNALVKLVPDSHDALLQLSLSQFRAGNSKAAQQTLEEILKINPEHIGALDASARIAIQDKELKLARDFLARIKAVKDSPTLSTLEGDILLAENKPEEAVTFFKREFGFNRLL